MANSQQLNNKACSKSRLCCLTADAAGDTKGGGDSRQNRNDCLNNKFPRFLFHILLMVKGYRLKTF